MLIRQMGVDHGRFNIRMPQKLLDRRQIDPAHDQMAGKGVAQGVNFGHICEAVLRNVLRKDFSLDKPPRQAPMLGIGVYLSA